MTERGGEGAVGERGYSRLRSRRVVAASARWRSIRRHCEAGLRAPGAAVNAAEEDDWDLGDAGSEFVDLTPPEKRRKGSSNHSSGILQRRLLRYVLLS